MTPLDHPNSSPFFSAQSALDDLPPLSGEAWARWENYRGPDLRSAPRFSLSKKLRTIFGGKRRRISNHRAHAPRRAIWEDTHKVNAQKPSNQKRSA